jgi:hypothetical protein
MLNDPIHPLPPGSALAAVALAVLMAVALAFVALLHAAQPAAAKEQGPAGAGSPIAAPAAGTGAPPVVIH